eukprot:1149611-Pelagomonas_calceolata.AAC.1
MAQRQHCRSMQEYKWKSCRAINHSPGRWWDFTTETRPPSAPLNLHVISCPYVAYANKLVTTRRAIKNNNTRHSQVMEPGASSNPPDPH